MRGGVSIIFFSLHIALSVALLICNINYPCFPFVKLGYTCYQFLLRN